MKAVLISIQPQWCAKIASGEKTIEVRKNLPANLATPFKCYIYCTRTFSGSNELFRNALGCDVADWDCGIWGVRKGKVIGEFVCDNIRCFDVPYPAFQSKMDKRILEQSCLSYYTLHLYAYHDALYGWHISDLIIYDKPKHISDFRKPCGNDLYCEECGMYCNNTELCGNAALSLARPPQSWCYVEV